MKTIHLRRTISVHCWRVIGQVAKAAKRVELMPVLLRARERGETDAGDVARHLFFEPDSRRVVAQRLLQISELYGLVEQRERRYRLTASGHAAVETEEVFVPEHGTWTLWASKDPLLSTPILHIEPWVEPTAYDEVWGKERDSARKRSFEDLPAWVRAKIGVVVAPLVGGAQIRIDQLETKGEVAPSESTLRATWDVTGGQLRVDGVLSKTVDAAIAAPKVAADAVWRQLLQAERLWPQWDGSVNALRVGFEETSAGERESLVRALRFERPIIESLGPFDPTTVEGVMLRARTSGDAARWAEWRLRARVRDYATAERFGAWTTEAVEPFSEFHPSTPSRQVLASQEWRAQTDRPTSRAWHLVAAEDWRL